jgi:thiamine-monophosphate kinase
MAVPGATGGTTRTSTPPAQDSSRPEAATTESELIERFRERLGSAGGDDIAVGSGDDAAVTTGEGAAVTSVDMLVEGVHFRRSTFPLHSIGHKALAAALSDLAAMGAPAGEAYVQLGLPADLDAAGALEIAGGLADLAAAHGVAVVGGDVVAAPQLVLAVTVVGRVPDPAAAVLRSGARPGEVLCVTGELGGAGAGLLLLEQPELDDGLDPDLADALRRRQLEPQPRLAAGEALAAAGASAMIDLSDGLGADAAHVSSAGGVRLEIELERLPIAGGVAAVAEAAGIDRFDLAAGAGEDYELLAAIPEGAIAGAAAEAAGIALTPIGRVIQGAGSALLDAARSEVAPGGFDHLRRVQPYRGGSGSPASASR